MYFDREVVFLQVSLRKGGGITLAELGLKGVNSEAQIVM